MTDRKINTCHKIHVHLEAAAPPLVLHTVHSLRTRDLHMLGKIRGNLQRKSSKKGKMDVENKRGKQEGEENTERGGEQKRESYSEEKKGRRKSEKKMDWLALQIQLLCHKHLCILGS